MYLLFIIVCLILTIRIVFMGFRFFLGLLFGWPLFRPRWHRHMYMGHMRRF